MNPSAQHSTLLSSANAYNPGSDLWFFPELKDSDWTHKVDWYLNFQILKNNQRASLTLSMDVSEILKQTGLNVIAIKTDIESSSLMISSQHQLPNRWVIVVPDSDSFSQWVHQLFEIWKNLSQPSFRVFLPPGQSSSSFLEAWRSLSPFENFTLVLDSEGKIRSN